MHPLMPPAPRHPLHTHTHTHTHTHAPRPQHSPENSEILTTLGILFLRANQTEVAFSHLTTSLSHDPRNPRTILAVGSIVQVGGGPCALMWEGGGPAPCWGGSPG